MVLFAVIIAALPHYCHQNVQSVLFLCNIHLNFMYSTHLTKVIDDFVCTSPNSHVEQALHRMALYVCV